MKLFEDNNKKKIRGIVAIGGCEFIGEEF